MIGLILPLIARTRIPKRFQKAAAWVALIVAAIALCGLVWGAWQLFLSNVREDAVEAHQQAQERKAAGNRELSAEERADDALRTVMAKQERDKEFAQAAASEAAKEPAQRATQAPQIKAINCAIMREDYTAAELAKIAAYRENCE